MMAEFMYDEIINNLPAVKSQMNILRNSNGSTMFTQSDTQMFATTYGPYSSNILVDAPQDKGVLFVNYRPRVGVPTIRELLNESFIKKTLDMTFRADLYSKYVVSVIVKELSPIGGLTSCALNAAYLALFDADIITAFPVASVTSIIDAEDRFVIEPDHLKLKTAKTVYNFAYHVDGPLLASHTEGSFIREQYLAAIKICRRAAQRIFDYYDQLANTIKN